MVSPTPTPAISPDPTISATPDPSSSLIPSPTPEISPSAAIVDISPNPSATIYPTSSPDITPSTSIYPSPLRSVNPANIGGMVCGATCQNIPDCPSGLTCYIEAGQISGNCRNPSCQMVADCLCSLIQANSQSVPTPDPGIIPDIPAAGNPWPTLIILLIGIGALVAGFAVL